MGWIFGQFRRRGSRDVLGFSPRSDLHQRRTFALPTPYLRRFILGFPDEIRGCTRGGRRLVGRRYGVDPSYGPVRCGGREGCRGETGMLKSPQDSSKIFGETTVPAIASRPSCGLCRVDGVVARFCNNPQTAACVKISIRLIIQRSAIPRKSSTFAAHIFGN